MQLGNTSSSWIPFFNSEQRFRFEQAQVLQLVWLEALSLDTFYVLDQKILHKFKV